MYRDPIFGSGQQAGDVKPACLELGFKFGDKGMHTSWTIMLDELAILLRVCAEKAPWADYVRALVDENCLGKQTVATRRTTLQRLTELYALDPSVSLFRMLRTFWGNEEKAHSWR